MNTSNTGAAPAVQQQAQRPVLVTGNTYPVRDRLKAMGARWDADAKGWRVPADRAEEAQRIVEAAGPKQAYPRGRWTSRAPRGSYSAPGGKRCGNCGQRDCEGAWGGLCDQD